MKIGDLVIYQWGAAHEPKHPDVVGTVLSFPAASHPKEFQKIEVLTEHGVIEKWVMQFCKVINESR